MNQQNSTPDVDADKTADVESAAAAKKAAAEKNAAEKAAQQQDVDETSEKLPKGHKRVTLVHPTTKSKVEVVKPSSDYTNFVRSYGYKEA